MMEAAASRLRLWGRTLHGVGPAGWIVAILAALLTVQVVRWLLVLITPVGPLGDGGGSGPVAMSAADRAALFERIDPFYRTADSATATAGAVTGLPLQLFGIRMNQAAGAGSAIIAGEDGQQRSIGVGEEIQPGVRLAAVQFDYVEIDNGGRRELLYLDQSRAPGATEAPPATAATSPLVPTPTGGTGNASALPISPQSLRAGIGWAPRMEGNRATGIIVRELGDGIAFQAAGFRPGDIIRAVNGRPISSPSDIAALTNQLQPGARLSLEVERGAGTVPIAITIPAGQP